MAGSLASQSDWLIEGGPMMWGLKWLTKAVGLLHILCAAVGGLLDFKSWGVIPQSALIRAVLGGVTAMDAELKRE